MWTKAENGWRQRSEVWREIDGLFRRGDLILDLGCGTGDDAVHLAASGVRVIGIDSSRPMIEIARKRGVMAHHVAIEQLSILSAPVDGAISNFGALNCVADLAPVARELCRLIRPGRPLVLCLLSRFWLRETTSFLGGLDFRKAFRRWPGRARWRGLEIFYPSSRHIRTTFHPWFRLKRSVSIGGGDHRLYVFERRMPC
jgi:ubiquinone/menaquinone biosynthesis C-methylase UbiE